MTVAQLIVALQELPPDAQVYFYYHCVEEGDSYGAFDHVELDRDGDVTLS